MLRLQVLSVFSVHWINSENHFNTVMRLTSKTQPFLYEEALSQPKLVFSLCPHVMSTAINSESALHEPPHEELKLSLFWWMWSISETNQCLIFEVAQVRRGECTQMDRPTHTLTHTLSQQSYLNTHILTRTVTQSFTPASNHRFEAMKVTV